MSRQANAELENRLRRVSRSPFLLLNALGTALRSPLILGKKLSRHFRGKKAFTLQPDAYRIPVITGDLVDANRREAGCHIAFLGPTYGEFRMMHAIAKRLVAADPSIRVTYCLRDHASIETVRSQFPKAAIAFMPTELLGPIKKWLRQVAPDVAIFIESSQPITAIALRTFGARTILVNGRFKKRSKSQNAWRAPFIRHRIGAYDLILFQNAESHANAAEWAPKKTKLVVTGDVKVDLTERERRTENSSLTDWLDPSSDPILMAGSTENAEEERMVMAAFQFVSLEMPCRLLIAPRKIDRSHEIEAIAKEMGMRLSKRTEPKPGSTVLLLDTLGELATAYQWGVAAYVGGAFVAGGKGHNVLEPLEWGQPVSYGMQRGLFKDQQILCESAGVGIRVNSSEELAAHWLEMLRQPAKRQEMGKRGIHMIAQNRGAIQKAVDAILDLVNARPSTKI